MERRKFNDVNGIRSNQNGCPVWFSVFVIDWNGSKMADEDLSESRSDENIFEILQKQAPFVSQFDDSRELAPYDDYNGAKTSADVKNYHCNLPGLQYPLQRKIDLEQAGISAGIDNVVNNKQQASPPEPKRPRLLMPTPNVQNGTNTNSDACQSPESGKRRRVQHDYRRLSSSGYVDDYEKGKDSRFSLSSDSDTSPLASKPRSNNSSPKTKPPNPFIGLKLLTLEKQAVGEYRILVLLQ